MLSKFESTLRSLGRDVAQTVPQLDGPLLELWNAYVRLYGHANAATSALARASFVRPPPFTVVDVDPAEITTMVEFSALPRSARDRQMFPKSRFQYAGSVIGGDWDQSDRRFEESELYRSFVAHFQDGVDWPQTALYDTILGYIDNGTPLWGCTTESEFRDRCRELDALYDAIRQHGYRSQAELLRAPIDDPVHGDTAVPYHLRLVNHELAVCIGRDGDILFKDGRDRLAIAKILGLDSIPVWVMIRHPRWQQLRVIVARNPDIRPHLADEIRYHPDLPSP
jgi:hypothetical protein